MSINQDFDYKGHKSTWASLSKKEGVFQEIGMLHEELGPYTGKLAKRPLSLWSQLLCCPIHILYILSLSSPLLTSPLPSSLSLSSSLLPFPLPALICEENGFPTVHEFACYTKFAHHSSSLIRNEFSISPSQFQNSRRKNLVDPAWYSFHSDQRGRF